VSSARLVPRVMSVAAALAMRLVFRFNCLAMRVFATSNLG
jgi:hypothetical protein